MEQIKVKILEGGHTAKEVNPVETSVFMQEFPLPGEEAYSITNLKEWEEQELNLRTFKIESVMVNGEIILVDEGYPRDQDVFIEAFPIGSIHKAEILINGKIRII